MRTIIFLSLVLVYSIAYSQKGNRQTGDKSIQYLTLFDKTSKPGVSCYRIPSLVTATNGDLIAAIDERMPSCGDLRLSNDINIVLRRSKNNGKTWSLIQTVVDYPLGQSASDPSMIADRITGEVFQLFKYMDLAMGKDVYYLRITKSRGNEKT